MNFKIITIPFDGERKTFFEEELNKFCLNKQIKRYQTEFFTETGKSFWTVFIEYEPILKEGKERKDENILLLLEKIFRNGSENGISLPIGNLTSQFFANVYLNGFDHFVKEQLGCKDYIRYMDDFVLFSHDKENLKTMKKTVASFLKDELKLSLKESATYINSNANGLGFLGRRIFPQVIRIKRENLKRSVKKLKRRCYEFDHNIIEEENFFNSIASISGYLSNGDNYNLRTTLI